MHGTKNINPVWGFCECGSDLHRSVKDALYTVTGPSVLRHDVLAQVSTGEGLRTF